MGMTRNIQSFDVSLRQSCFRRVLCACTKPTLLAEMVDALVDDRLVPAAERDGVLAAVCAREAQMSTGMQFGIALPHGKHAAVSGLVTMIGLHPDGVDFDALDGMASRIFVMTLSPPETIGPHLQFLAAIGRLLGRPAIRQAVMDAEDKDALLRVLL